MKYLRYKGEFFSVQGTLWRVELWQESDKEYDVVGDLTFDADEPLVLEWDTKPKEEVICGSTATLKIISPGDRTYEDLYSIEVGRVRLDVYRNDTLYWSGCIDAEFYEEPYEQFKGYTVTLGFSDFGVLDRIKYNLIGMQSLYDIVNYGLSRCGINYEGINESLISTQLSPSSRHMSLADIKVRSDNFYDEDGEASTIYDVLEGILQPLALRLIQREGKVYIYDLNGLYTKAGKEQIEWNGSSQTMNVDTVYNNAKITWSPYQQSKDLLPTKCWDENIETPDHLSHLDNVFPASYGDAFYISAHHDVSLTHNLMDSNDSGFTTWFAEKGNNADIICDHELLSVEGMTFIIGPNFYKLVPQLGGDESEGIAILTSTYNIDWVSTPNTNSISSFGAMFGVKIDDLIGTNPKIPILYKSQSIWLPPVANPDALLVRVTQNMLMDTRINPFVEANNLGENGINHKDRYDYFGKHANIIYVPVLIKFQPDDSNDVYVWTDADILSGLSHAHLGFTTGRWVKYLEPNTNEVFRDIGHLAYYDPEYKEESCGVLGWKRNRSIINGQTEFLYSTLTSAEDGQYIPYPNFGNGGKLWIEVCGYGWYVYSKTASETDKALMMGWLNWILMELPEIAIVRNRLNGLTLDDEDIEYDAELNVAAKEPIEMDTICGTHKNGMPLARGAYFNVDNKQITEFTRASRTSQVEDLLIGTLYSQYAKRHTVLSGDSQLLIGPIVAFTEQNQPNKLFMMSGDVQDIRADYSDATFVEFRPDEYKRVNE